MITLYAVHTEKNPRKKEFFSRLSIQQNLLGKMGEDVKKAANINWERLQSPHERGVCVAVFEFLL